MEPKKTAIQNILKQNATNMILYEDSFVKTSFFTKEIPNWKTPIFYFDFDLQYTGFVNAGITPSLKNLTMLYPENGSLREDLKSVIEKISNTIDALNPFEEKKDYFATSILSESINLQFDSEGRISLTPKLLKHAKIKDSMLFVGLGKIFQIWEPTIFEKFRVHARKKSNINRASLKWELQLNKK